MKEEKHLTVRVEKVILAKFKHACDYEGRSMNKQLLLYIRNTVKEFEAKHGAIELQQDEE